MIDNKQILDLSEKLKDIPHLNITKFLPEVPVSAMLTDLEKFKDDDFYPYHNGLIREEFLSFLKAHWKGMCLIENCKEGRHHTDYKTTDDHSLTFHPDNSYYPTDIGELVPNIIKFLYTITKTPHRTRLLRLLPGGEAGWHSHYALGKSGLSEVDGIKIVNPVIHIPLITNKHTEMVVSRTNPINEKDNVYYKQHYNVGEVWVFNSHHYHNVFNWGKTPRDHIMMYMALDDEIMFPILQKAVSEYCGELV